MNRKEFLSILGIAALTPIASIAAASQSSNNVKLKITKRHIHIGIKEPIKVVHITDTHLSFADERDNERKNKLARRRHKEFCGSSSMDTKLCPMLANLNAAIAYANANKAMLLHTGDLIDFASKKNFELAGEALSKCDSLMAVGNHEFSQYVGEAPENEAYKKQSWDDVQKLVKSDIRFASRIYGGVNFVTIDNNYYYFASDAVEKLKSEIAKGYPIILAFHMPIYTPELFDTLFEKSGRKCSWLVGVPPDKLALYPNKNSAQKPNKTTMDFISYIKTQPSIKAVIAGHVHMTFEEVLFGDTHQYCGATTCSGDIQEFIID